MGGVIAMNFKRLIFIGFLVMTAVCTEEVEADANNDLVSKLHNSLWCAQASKPLVLVDSFGREGGGVSSIEGVKLCFSLWKVFGQLLMSEFWWRETDGQYMKVGMAVPVTANSLEYHEAEQANDSIYPTIKVGGTLRKNGKYLEMTQQGYMKDGLLVSYTNRFVRADNVLWPRN